MSVDEAARRLALLRARLAGKSDELGGEPLRVAGADRLRGRDRRPGEDDPAAVAQHPLEAEPLGRRGEEERQPLLARATGAAAPVLERLRVLREVGVEHEGDAGEVEAAGGDVGGDEDPGAAVAERLSARVRSAWVSSPESATTSKPRSERLAAVCWTASRVPRNTRALGGVEGAQHVHEGVLALARRDDVAAVLDVARAPRRRRRRHARRVAGVLPRELEDGLRQRRREEHGAALGGVASRMASSSSRKPMSSISSASSRTTVPRRRQVEGAALEVIAEAPRRPDDHMGPAGRARASPPRPSRRRSGDPRRRYRRGATRAPAAPGRPAPGSGRRRGRGARRPPRTAPRSRGRVGEEEAEGDGLPGAGPGRDEEVPAGEGGVEHGGLDRRRLAEAAGGEGGEEGAVRTGRGEVHGGFLPDGGAARRVRRGTYVVAPLRACVSPAAPTAGSVTTKPCRPPAAAPRAPRRRGPPRGGARCASPEPEAALPRAPSPVEALEQVGELVRWDARAPVRDAHGDPAPARSAETSTELSAARTSGR